MPACSGVRLGLGRPPSAAPPVLIGDGRLSLQEEVGVLWCSGGSLPLLRCPPTSLPPCCSSTSKTALTPAVVPSCRQRVRAERPCASRSLTRAPSLSSSATICAAEHSADPAARHATWRGRRSRVLPVTCNRSLSDWRIWRTRVASPCSAATHSLSASSCLVTSCSISGNSEPPATICWISFRERSCSPESSPSVLTHAQI
mmetsp:Transcript_45280/g.106250  ORF Transcript_45280/g.106250 Transcript_45280/m.106250 type:complete len:201 (-) Transcript_45280:324-926(-)